jgi:integrating conjugative element protein (TIGR03746 family)
MDDREIFKMNVFKQALGNAKLAILALGFALVLSFSINLFLGFALYRVPKTITVNVPPVIPDNGLRVKAGSVTPARIYAFAYYIWQSIQTWTHDGLNDYAANLKTFSPYLTSDFQNTLKQEGKKMNAEGFLFKHQQMTFGANGSGFDPENVKYIGDGVWLVHLVMRTINAVAPPNDTHAFSEAHVAMDAETSFIFKVVKYNYAPDKNKWGLAIAGYAAPPKTIKINK